MTTRHADHTDEALRLRKRDEERTATSEASEPMTWQTLQRSLGNQAVRRLVETAEADAAKRQALTEELTPIPRALQERIGAESTGGRPLDVLTRAEMEPIVGTDLSGVRLHEGPGAERMSRQLKARAFTQGRDVFMGERSRGRETLAHELTHATQGLTGPGTVQREEDDKEDEDDIPQVSMQLPGPGEQPKYIDKKKKKRIQTLDEFHAGPKGPKLDPKVEAMIEGTYDPQRDDTYEEKVEKQFDQKRWDEEQQRKKRRGERAKGGKTPDKEKLMQDFPSLYGPESDPAGDLEEPREGTANLLIRHRQQESSVTSEPSTGGKEEKDPSPRLPTIAPKQPAPQEAPKPVEEFAPQKFNIELTIDNNKKEYKGLTAEEAITELKKESLWCYSLIEIYRKWHEELRENRYNHRIVGWIADRLGGHGDPPTMEIWNIVENRLNRAGNVLQKGPEQLKAEFEESKRRQAVDQAQRDEQRLRQQFDSLKAGREERRKKEPELPTFEESYGTFEDFKKTDISFKRFDPREKYHAWESFMEGHIGQSTKLLQDAAEAIEGQRAGVYYYKEGSIKGAEQGIEITKKIQKYNNMVARLLPVGGPLKTAIWNAAFTGGTELAGQASEVHYGLRDEIDFSEIGKDMLKDGVTGFVTGVAAGKLTKIFGNALRRRIVAAKLGVELSEVALGKVQQWLIGTVAGVAVSPLNAPVRQVMEYHMGQRDKVTVEGLVEETVDNLPETLLFSAIGSTVGTVHSGGGPEPVGGGAPKPAAPAKPAAPVVEAPAAAPARPVAEPAAKVTPAAEPVAPAATPKPVEAPAPAPTEAPVTPAVAKPAVEPTATRAVAPKAAGGSRRRGSGARKTTRPKAEPSAETLAVGDKRTVTRAIGEGTRPSTEVTEPTADELAVGDKRTTTRAAPEEPGATEEMPALKEPTADELAVGDKRTTTRAVPEEPGATREMSAVEEPAARKTRPVEEADLVEMPEEVVMQPPNPRDPVLATRIYENTVSARREAALYHNPETGEYIIIQGEEGTAQVAPGEGPVAGRSKAQRWKEILDANSDRGRWELQRHSHPSEEGGYVAPVNRMASGAGGDMQVMAAESIGAGGVPRSSVIDYMTPQGPKQTEFGFDPNLERPFWVQPPDGAPRLSFRTIEQYQQYLEQTFPGEVGHNPIPEWLSGNKPVQHARQAALDAQAQRARAQAVTAVMPAVEPTQRMNVEAPTQEMPSQRTTQRMDVQAPTQEMPSQRTTQRMNGAAGGPAPRPEGPSGRVTARVEAQGGLGEPPPMPVEAGPLGGPQRGGPVEPRDVVPIESEIEANQILNTQVQARRPIRLIPNHDDVVDAWRAEYGQQGGEPPPAWLDESGKLVVDASRVKTIGTLSGPIPPPRPQAAESGRTMGTEPPRSRGEDEGFYNEEALPPWEPRQFEPPRVEMPISDATEAESAYWDQDASNPESPPGMTFDPKTYQANWELAGGKGTAPPGWFDQYGRLNVDANRVNVHQGPIPTGGGSEPGPGPGPAPLPSMPGGPGAGIAPRASQPEGADGGPGALGPAGQPKTDGGGVVEQEQPDSSRTTQKMGRVSATDIMRRKADGLRYIRENDVHFYHATNRAIVRLMQQLESSGRAWASDGGGLWVTTDPTSAFFSEGQVSRQRTQQIYDRYGVPFDDTAAALAREPVFFEVDIESLPSPAGAGDVMGEFGPGAPGRSGVATDFKISDLTGSPLSTMRETTSLKAPSTGPERAGPAADDDVVIIEDEDEGSGASGQAPREETPQIPAPPKLPAQPGGGAGGRGAGPGTARTWGPMSREVVAEINDPHVAAQLFIEQVRGGNPNARAIRNADMVATAWRYTYRRYTTPPMAWLDANGNIVIDGTRVDPRIAPGYGTGGA